MADKWPSANGVWSNAANWNGGTKPIAGDDVYADGKTVTIDEDFTVASVRVTQRSGGTLGGTFNISSNRILTANGLGFTAVIGGAPICLNVLSGCSTLELYGNLQAGGNGGTCVAISTAAIVTINGNITGGNGSGHGVLVTAAATLNVTGNLTGGSGSGQCVSITAAATLNVTGDVTSGTSSGSHGINNTIVAATIYITGNVTSQAGFGINSNQNSTINITGNLTANNANAVFLTAASPTVTVVGTITASNSAVGLNQTGGTVTISTPCLNSTNGVMAVFAPNVKIYNAIASWRFATDVPATNKFIYSAGVALGNPVIGDVRDGTVYGASLELTGSLIMAVPSDVRKSVPTDATVGTADLTAQDIFTEIASSSDPIAVRLRNTATVQTTGAQLASYN